MPGFVKIERRKVVSYKDGAVYKTKIVGFEWFPICKQPECYKVDSEDFMWVATTEYHFGEEPPK
jgi:hypothetical protein